MHIAGVVIHAHPDQLSSVQDAISAMSGVEIHGSKEDGRLVVTVEQNSYRETSDTILSLHQIKGVLTASLVYQHSEDLEDETTH